MRTFTLPRDVVAGAIVVAAGLILAQFLGNYHVYVLSIVAIYTLASASIVVLMGAAGQVSMGHAALLGAGGYGGLFIARQMGSNVLVEVLFAVVVAGLVGLLIGLPSLRLSELYLAIGTLALGFAGQQIFFQWREITGGGAGIAIPAAELFGISFKAPRDFLYLCIAVAAVGLLLARNLLHGRTGRALNALRTSPYAASSSGVSIGPHKMAAFGISAAMVGVAGVLYSHAVNYVAPEDYNIALSIMILMIPIIGGVESLWGALVGSIFVIGLPESLRFARQYQLLIYGALLLGSILFLPEGLYGGGKRLVTSLRRKRAGAVKGDQVEQVIARTEPMAPRSQPKSNGGTAVIPVSANGRKPAALKLERVCVDFGGVRAVDDVSVDITPGTVTGLVGPNGAGKTTLFNAVSGYVSPSQGVISVDGERIDRLPPGRRVAMGIARTFQHVQLFQGMTVREHALLGQHTIASYGPLAQVFRGPSFLTGEAMLERRADELLRELELDRFTHDLACDLPYGLQKRVDVARALASRPRLLLLDEPAAGLLPNEADSLLEEVMALCARQGTSIVIVEHNIDLVLRICHRVVALHAGRVITDGEPGRVRNDQRFVESYLGV